MPFTKQFKSHLPCPKCFNQSIVVDVWESSDGAHEDERASCSNELCDYVEWFDGSDY